ncbi:hypothetical protein B0H11DRAFT_2248229 [Mycena galericulata]|nr:hypothetical protein B0H11DRAFT_2248229 [Mycena galericulata]
MSKPEPSLTCPILALDGTFRLKKKTGTDLQKGESMVNVDFLFLKQKYFLSSDICVSYDISCQLHCSGHLTFSEMDTTEEQRECKEGKEGMAVKKDSPTRGSRMSSQSDNCWYHIPPNLFTQDRYLAFDCSEDFCCTLSPIKPCYAARTLRTCTKYLASLADFRTFFMKDTNGGVRQIRPIWFLVDEDATTEVGEAMRLYHARPPSDEAPTVLTFPTKAAADAYRHQFRREREEMG